jgi:hypothetical protein
MKRDRFLNLKVEEEASKGVFSLSVFVESNGVVVIFRSLPPPPPLFFFPFVVGSSVLRGSG